MRHPARRSASPRAHDRRAGFLPFSATHRTRSRIEGTRAGAYDGITIHSVRLRGLVAHQEVLFGSTGETLTIRHDSMSREAYMPGILLAVREVMQRDHLIIGLERADAAYRVALCGNSR